MNRNDLYNSLQEVDDEILERSEKAGQGKRRPAWLWWGAVAACLCLVAAVLLAGFPLAGLRSGAHMPSADTADLPGNNPGEDPDGTGEGIPDSTPNGTTASGESIPYGNTSDTYTTLPELLAYLGGHETHDTDMAAVGGSDISAVRSDSGQPAAAFTENTGAAVNAAGEYAYHIGESSICISHLDGTDTKNVGSLDVAADGIFICNDILWVISQDWSGLGIEDEINVRVSAYDITVPLKPVLLDEYTQRGELMACWLSGGDLYLVTGDGMCACGWSRLDDPAGYYPGLSHVDEAIEWGDDDISVLGEPTKVQYSAITVIDGVSREIVGKEALYGDILELFYGADWIAVAVEELTDDSRQSPVIYTFDGELTYTGKIDVAQAADVPGINELEARGARAYLGIDSVTNHGGIYRMLGTYTIHEGESTEDQYMAVAAETRTGAVNVRLLSASAADDSYSSYTEILWEESRAIAAVGVTHAVREEGELTDVWFETKFLFVEFNGLDIFFHENELTADYLNSRVGVSYGSPFGNIRTLIPVGQGRYVRYYNNAEKPGGFEIFDFSDSAAPRRLYRAEPSLSGNDAFDYVWHVYDENTFGTLKIYLEPGEESDGAKLSWCVYTVASDSETAITLKNEYISGEDVERFVSAEQLGSVVFQAGTDVYFVTGKMDSAVWIG